MKTKEENWNPTLFPSSFNNRNTSVVWSRSNNTVHCTRNSDGSIVNHTPQNPLYIWPHRLLRVIAKNEENLQLLIKYGKF